MIDLRRHANAGALLGLVWPSGVLTGLLVGLILASLVVL
jgi:hypothetical protein